MTPAAMSLLLVHVKKHRRAARRQPNARALRANA